jgi:molybdate transport system substrate-binding protein
MKMKKMLPALLIKVLLLLLTSTQAAAAAELRVAVAANFYGTLQRLGAMYQEQTGHTLALSPGASGALYTQVVNGAPFDLFFSADPLRPEMLANAGYGVPESRFTYAIGLPVLWSTRDGFVDDTGEILKSYGFRFLAIAEPRNAPYGVAAQQVMTHLGVWDRLDSSSKLVRAQNIGQAYSQVASGAAELGFVALAQVREADGNVRGSYWIPPAEIYDPIIQQAIILQRASNMQAAQDFLAWMRGPEAIQIILAAGYAVEQ